MPLHELHQRSIIGRLSLPIHPKEWTLLALRHAPADEMPRLWSDLWEGVPDYDHLPAGCRMIMPSVVRRMQMAGVPEEWKRVHGLDLSFLAGLPRFVWTKNQHMLNLTRRIAEHLGARGVEIVAIKGMAELLADGEIGMMRSTVDLDLLVRPENYETFKKGAAEFGYEEVDLSAGRWIRSPLPKTEHLLRAPERGAMEIDVHLVVNKFHYEDRFTDAVWEGKVASGACATLFVPSPRERFWIAVANAFRVHNWSYGAYLKYVNDAMLALSRIKEERDSSTDSSGDQLSNDVEEAYLAIFEEGRRVASLQDWQEQVFLIKNALMAESRSSRPSGPATGNMVNHESGLNRFSGLLPAIRLDGKLVYAIHARAHAIQMVLASFWRIGFSWQAVIFLLVGPVRSLLRGMLTFILRVVCGKKSRHHAAHGIHQAETSKVRWRMHQGSTSRE